VNLVSVIIPLYNCEARILATLKSVALQTYPYIEVIVVDDASNDNSLDLVRKYKMCNLQVITQENAGAAVARNRGLQIARGSYIQFLDAGDELSHDKIEAQVNALQNTNDKVAVCNYVQFSDDDDIENLISSDQSAFIYSSNDPADFLLNLWGGYGSMNFIQTNSWLVPRAVIDKSGHWREYRCPDDDGEFFARVILACKGIVHTPSVYNYYHISHGGVNQLSRSTNYKYQMNTLLTIDLKHRYLLAHSPHPLLNKAIAAQYYRFAVDIFPARKTLSAIAWKRFKDLREQPPHLKLGGSFIQLIYNFFGWRISRMIRYYLRRS
jgi:glycosyltransferase involved in cell wall biosynthesis